MLGRFLLTVLMLSLVVALLIIGRAGYDRIHDFTGQLAQRLARIALQHLIHVAINLRNRAASMRNTLHPVDHPDA